MSKHIEYWDADTYERKVSEGKYEEYTIHSTVEREDYFGRITEAVNKVLYVDTATGLYVADVAAYEKWLGSL